MAIDLDKTGGRHILGHIEDGKLILEEIYRFDNIRNRIEEEKYPDLEHMFQEIKNGLIRSREIGKLPIFVGIDAWGGAVVLLDSEEKVCGSTMDVKDETNDTFERLKHLKERHPENIEKSSCILMLPDYFHYLLSGSKRCEYTNAVTTQLINPLTKTWDEDLIEGIGYPTNIFPKISWPGMVYGNLRREITEEIGFDLIIVQPVTLNTASAVLAIPSMDKGYTGPFKPSAIGNLLVLMITGHELENLKEARELVKNTFTELKEEEADTKSP